MKLYKQFLTIALAIIGSSNVAQVVKQLPIEQSSKSHDSLSRCITLDEMLQQIEARDKRLEAKVKQTKLQIDLITDEDYSDFLTLELASSITGFDPSKAKKMHILKGMTGEILRYNWEN